VGILGKHLGPEVERLALCSPFPETTPFPYGVRSRGRSWQTSIAPTHRPRLADSRSKTQNRRPRCFKFMTSVRLPIVSEADRRLYWLPLAQTGLMGSMGLIFRNKSPSLLAGAEHLGGHGPGPGPWPSWRSKPSSGWAITAVPHSRVLEWMISATFALKGSLLMLKASDEWIPSFSRHSLRKIRGTVACS